MIHTTGNIDATSYEFKCREIDGGNVGAFQRTKQAAKFSRWNLFKPNCKGGVHSQRNSSDLVAIIISIPSLGANQWNIETIKGFTNKPCIFVTRKQHWYKNIVIPTLKKYSDYFDLKINVAFLCRRILALTAKISFLDKVKNEMIYWLLLKGYVSSMERLIIFTYIHTGVYKYCL